MTPILQYDQVEIDSTKIVSANHPTFGTTTTFKDVVIAREIVHPYDDGIAFKPADELEKAYDTAEGAWAVAGGHPETPFITSRDQINGRTINARFTRSLKDPKTRRPNNRGILADLEIFDNRVAPELLADLKNGKKRHVSIGFFFDKDESAGVINDAKHPLNGAEFDYVQRGIMINHTAFGIDSGRCPMPFCGIGADEMFERHGTGDPFAGFKNHSECVERFKDDPKIEDPDAFCAFLKRREKEKGDESLKFPSNDNYSMEKLIHWKVQVDEILSQFDDLVEEESQGNLSNITESERARTHFNISREDWEGLTDDEKKDYISRLPLSKPLEGELSKDEDSILTDQGFQEFISNCLKDDDKTFSECVEAWNARKKDEGDCVDCPESVANDLSMTEISEKIVELEAQRREVLDKIDKLGQATQFNDLWEQMRKVDGEIGLFLQAKAIKLAEDAIDSYTEFIVPHLEEDVALTSQARRNLPDEDFAFIESGCEKVDGKTEDKCRHFPIHDKAHVTASLQALGGARTGKKPKFADEAKPAICAAAKKNDIESEVCGTEKKGDALEEALRVLGEHKEVKKDFEYLTSL